MHSVVRIIAAAITPYIGPMMARTSIDAHVASEKPVRRNNAVTLLIVVCAIGAILQLMRFALPGSSLGTAAAEHVLLLVAAWIKLDPLTHAMYIVAYGSLAGGAAIHYRILAV